MAYPDFSERNAKIVRLVTVEGKSFSQTAKAIGGGLTRSAVAGVVDRHRYGKFGHRIKRGELRA